MAMKNFCANSEIQDDNLPKALECFDGWINIKYTGNADKIMAIPMLVSTGLDSMGKMVITAVSVT